MDKDVIFLAKCCSVLTETERPFKMDSRRSANFFFLTSGIKKAQRVESTINPKSVNTCHGAKEDLDKPMKKPRDIKIKAAASAYSKLDHSISGLLGR